MKEHGRLLLCITVTLFLAVCSFPERSLSQEEEQSTGGRFLASIHSLGKGFTEATEDAEIDYNMDFALARVKQNPVLGLFPLAMLIAGLVMNFSAGMVIGSSAAAFVILVYFPTFTPAVGAFFLFAAIYHFVLRPDR